jgi:hemoglobin/transferrin/lactoferrin receptor protein
LDHIPPIFGRASIGYQNSKFRVELVNRFNGKKPVEDYAVNSIVTSPDGSRTIRRNGTEDNLERATPEGSLAWQTWNLYTSWQVGKKLAIQVSVENILDTHYRLFASGVSAPGRNFIFTLRSNF